MKRPYDFDDYDDDDLQEEEAEEDLLENEFSLDEDDVEISMEVDAQGNELWYAEDPSVPGASSMGHSADEAIEGVEERRRQYRDMLKRTRDAEDEDDLADVEPPPPGDGGVEVSMEIDEHGNEVWYAKDSRLPGSGSMGHSVEEAVEGLDDRRRQYREMLKRSRKEHKKRKSKPD